MNRLKRLVLGLTRLIVLAVLIAVVWRRNEKEAVITMPVLMCFWFAYGLWQIAKDKWLKKGG